jgi:hypothetical protein
MELVELRRHEGLTRRGRVEARFLKRAGLSRDGSDIDQISL